MIRTISKAAGDAKASPFCRPDAMSMKDYVLGVAKQALEA